MFLKLFVGLSAYLGPDHGQVCGEPIPSHKQLNREELSSNFSRFSYPFFRPWMFGCEHGNAVRALEGWGLPEALESAEQSP